MTAYALYNEIDEYAADWLENLIRFGLIAPGIVDRRSIEDIRGDDLRGFRQVHFFAGIGVWSYALRRAGISDDTALWTGSCPCQPFSAAGKGDGVDDERHLWPALLHLIRERRPERFFGEQVASKDGLGWLDIVQADMEAEGYAIGAVDTCSAGSGAPHIRQRLRLYAYDLRLGASRLADDPIIRQRIRAGLRHFGSAGQRRDEFADVFEPGWLDNNNNKRLEGLGSGPCSEGGWDRALRPTAAASESGRVANSASGGQRECWRQMGQGQVRHPDSSSNAFGGLADSDGWNASAEWEQRGGEQRQQSQDGGVGDLADTSSGQLSQPFWGAEGRDGHGPDRSYARPGPTNGFWRDADWVFCRDEKWRPIRPGSFPLVDGTSFRVDSGSPYAGKSRQGMLKAFGNAIDAEATIDFLDACLEHRTIELEPISDLAAGGVEGLLV